MKKTPNPISREIPRISQSQSKLLKHLYRELLEAASTATCEMSNDDMDHVGYSAAALQAD